MRELAADGIPVAVTCPVLKLACQPYYRWLADPVTETEWVQAHRVDALWDADGDDPTFGYRFRAGEARRAGWRMSRRTAWKLCSKSGITSAAQRRRRGKGKRSGPPVFDDLVKRIFTADAPNRVRLTDIAEDWATWNPAIVATPAARSGDVAGCILHAERVSQFRSRKMVKALNRHGMVGSMGRVGAAGDNAAMESFWSLLQTNVLNQRRWRTHQELRLAIVTEDSSGPITTGDRKTVSEA